MTREKLIELLLSKKWKKTTTFKLYPHSYSLEKNWDNKELFAQAWNFINRYGEERVFYRRVYRYYKIDTHEYWAMHTSDGDGIINRAKIIYEDTKD